METPPLAVGGLTQLCVQTTRCHSSSNQVRLGKRESALDCSNRFTKRMYVKCPVLYLKCLRLLSITHP